MTLNKRAREEVRRQATMHQETANLSMSCLAITHFPNTIVQHSLFVRNYQQYFKFVYMQTLLTSHFIYRRDDQGCNFSLSVVSLFSLGLILWNKQSCLCPEIRFIQLELLFCPVHLLLILYADWQLTTICFFIVFELQK